MGYVARATMGHVSFGNKERKKMMNPRLETSLIRTVMGCWILFRDYLGSIRPRAAMSGCFTMPDNRTVPAQRLSSENACTARPAFTAVHQEDHLHILMITS